MNDPHIVQVFNCRYREFINNQKPPNKIYHIEQKYKSHVTEYQGSLNNNIDKIHNHVFTTMRSGNRGEMW